MNDKDVQQPSARGWTVAALAGLIGLGIGAGIATAVSVSSTPHTLDRPAASTGTFTAEQASVDDARQVTLAATLSAPTDVVLQRAGIVTSSACSPGAVLASGQPVGTVDGRGVIGLASAIPQWQPFTVGTTGSDVQAVTTELARIGKLPATVTTLDATTVRTLATLAGVPGETVLPPGTFGWLPRASVAWATCSPAVGKPAAGTVLGTLTPVLQGLDLTTIPTDATPGARTVTVGGVTVPAVEGRVSDLADLGKIAATATFVDFQRSNGQTPLSGVWKLAEPVAAWRLPAGSVVGHGDQACVSVDGRAIHVRVVASSLGKSLVKSDATLSRVDYPAPGGLTCP